MEMIDRKSTGESGITLEELEAVTRRAMSRLVAAVLANPASATDAMNRAAEQILATAELAAAIPDEPAPPRPIREQRATIRAVHLDDPGATGRERPACRVPVRYHKPLVTTDPAAVTCHSCLATAAYGAAAMGLAS